MFSLTLKNIIKNDRTLGNRVRYFFELDHKNKNNSQSCLFFSYFLFYNLCAFII